MGVLISDDDNGRGSGWLADLLGLVLVVLFVAALWVIGEMTGN